MPFLSPQPWLRMPCQAKRSEAVGIRLGRASPAPRLLPKVPRQLEGTGQAGTMQQRALSGTCASTQPPILQVGDWQGREEGREGRERESALSATPLGQEPLPSPRVPAHGAVPVHTDCTLTAHRLHTYTRATDLYTHTHTRGQDFCKRTHTDINTHTHMVINCAHTHAETSAHGLCLSLLHTCSPCSCMPTHTHVHTHIGSLTHTYVHAEPLYTHLCAHRACTPLQTHGQTDLQQVSTHAH